MAKTGASQTVKRDFCSAKVRLTYADCDPAGIVYFGTWFPLMERLLSEWLFEQDLRSDKLLEKFGFATITREAQCEYLYPAELFDEISILMFQAKIGNSSVQWHFQMSKEPEGKPVGLGHITLVTIDATGQPVRIPEKLRTAVQEA